MYFIIALYAVTWFVVTPLWAWVNYLDVKTTLRGRIQAGDIEANPEMVPYVKTGDFWLMVRGKLKIEYYLPLVALLLPIFVISPIISAIRVYSAVRSNEKLDNSQGVLGNSSISKKGA